MASMIRTVFFTLFFRKIGTENVGFFFSIYENRALNTGSNLLRSSSAKDTMLCARACATQINCQTAIFHFDENKCELYEKRTEDILKTMVKSEGHHLITKVRIGISNLKQEIKANSAIKMSDGQIIYNLNATQIRISRDGFSFNLLKPKMSKTLADNTSLQN